jgi:hypothetical protein
MAGAFLMIYHEAIVTTRATSYSQPRVFHFGSGALATWLVRQQHTITLLLEHVSVEAAI